MTTKLIDVMLCVNDDYGNTSNKIDRLYIPDLINLDGPIEGGMFEMGDGCIKLEDKYFPYVIHNSLVGNMAYECIWVIPQVAADMLNHIRISKGWDCEEAEKHTHYKWTHEYTFEARDIEFNIPIETQD